MSERDIRFWRSIRDSLRTIQQHLHAIRDQEERRYEQEKARSEPPPPPVIHAELHTPERIEREQRASSNRNLTVQKALAVGTWLAFIAAAYYAGVAKSQLNASIKAMRIDQRCWLYVNFVPSQFSVGPLFRQALELGNPGKTPVIRYSGKAVTLFVHPDWIATFSDEHGTAIAGGTIVPTHPHQAWSILLPAGTPPKARVVPLVFTPEMAAELNAGAANIVTYGRLEYEDYFGIHHWVTFCGADTTKVAGANWWGACVAYNDIDRN